MSKQPKIIAIIGARPQFIKHFPFEKASIGRLNLLTIHTGQHYDSNMSEVFFNQLGMQKPHHTLHLGGGNHGSQTGKMMMEIEEIVLSEQPDGVVVYGDTNSTLAGALVAAKLYIPIFHIEAGLRSYNMEMPEEVNRVLTDHISTLLFTPSEVSVNNLKKEGILKGVHEVGDIMKDLVDYVVANNHIGIRTETFDYYYVTIHRPYNTDDKARLLYILKSLDSMQKRVIMSLHPRTKSFMERYEIAIDNYPNIKFIDPQSYFDNLTLIYHSSGLITDSGGMQKEAYWLEKKCVTIRKETEWIETISSLGNVLLFEDLSSMERLINEKPEIWDLTLYGNAKTANKIVDFIGKHFSQ